uniref:Uncharacterized protein n=1 Tax=Leptobrachium leishanense TaxID=445787 RepID=A0A8C5PKV5_9ANUR
IDGSACNGYVSPEEKIMPNTVFKIVDNPAIRQCNQSTLSQPRHVVHDRPATLNHSVWNKQNAVPYVNQQMVSPMTQYVQQYPLGCHQPGYQVPPHWQVDCYGPRNLFELCPFPPLTTFFYPCGDFDDSSEIMQDFFTPERMPPPSSPQKKCVHHSTQTVLSLDSRENSTVVICI